MNWDDQGNTPAFAKHNEKEILGFFGEYRFLSNFWKASVDYNGHHYPTSEHAYQATKFIGYDEEAHRLILESRSQAESKKLAKLLVQSGRANPEFQNHRVKIMLEISIAKYSQHAALGNMLLATDNRYLEERNSWGDLFWGVDTFGRGDNYLGKCLMVTRDFIRQRQKLIFDFYSKHVSPSNPENKQTS